MSEEFEEVTEKSKKGLKAKDVSLAGKIAGATLIVTGAILKWLNIFTNCQIDELCKVGLTVMAVFGTIDINIALDKIFKKE
ncbi:MAG: hypothetical protein MJ174_07355 [Treponema sp.]|nr:hypothetical protein [Treponema sp.]